MLLARVLARVLGEGQLTIIDAGGRPHQLVGARPGPAVTMRIHTWWTGIRLALRPRLAFGESYMDGKLSVEDGDIYDLLDLLGRNIAAIDSTPLVRWSFALQRILRWLEQYNPVGRAQRNVAHHYDLNDQLYDFFLDRDRQYSCAYFTTPGESLEQAQIDKKRHIAAKLLLKSGQRVLDIGSGWGGFLKFAAERYGIEGVGITISKEQAAFAEASKGGLPIETRLMDYMALEGQFDRVISIGMFEHVGYKNYEAYFARVRSLLRPDGLFLLHTIGNNFTSTHGDPWTEKYIFPNGQLPSIRQIATATERKFVMEDWHSFGADYDRTLMAWWDNFNAAWPDLRDKYGDRFWRMWRFYLQVFAAMFRARNIQLWQVVLSPDGIRGGYRRFS